MSHISQMKGLSSVCILQWRWKLETSLKDLLQSLHAKSLPSAAIRNGYLSQIEREKTVHVNYINQMNMKQTMRKKLVFQCYLIKHVPL